MKKIILSLSMLIAVSASSLYATDPGPLPKDSPEQIFKKSFPTAECVKWSREGEYRKVSFLLYGKGAQAYFSPEGDLLGTARNILYADLPIRVMIAIKKRFGNAVPFAITEISKSEETSYKFSVELESRRYNATVSHDGSLDKVVAR